MPPPNKYLDKVYEKLGYSDRPFLRHAWKNIVENETVIIEAPTGYGKTTLSQAYSLYSIDNGFKTIIAYPLRTLLEDQYSRFNELFKRMGFNNYVGTRYMHHLYSYYFVRPVTLTTIDTLSMTLFGLEPRDLDKVLEKIYGSIIHTLGHYLFARATTLLSNIVLDETHLLADTTRSLNFLASLILISQQNGSKILMESATIPESLVNSLKSFCKNVPCTGIHVVEFNESIDPEFIEEREEKEIYVDIPEEVGENKYEKILEWMREARREVGGNGFRALIVFNTVAEAIKMYEKLLDSEFKDLDIYLLHSRFREKDRDNKIEELRNKTGELRKILRDRDGGVSSINYIVVATQVIEAGVDISSNVFITDIAPANSLIQRLGRFLRYSGEKHGYLKIWYESFDDKEYYKVYSRRLVEKTLDQLRGLGNRFNPHIPSIYRSILNKVYSLDDYRISYSEVEELVSLTLTVSSPREATRKFLELGGSFIRENIMVPVITEEECGREDVEKLVIPLSLKSLKRKHVVKELIERDGKLECRSFTFMSDRKGVMKRILSREFKAFVVKGVYDPVKGLIIGEEAGGRG